MSNIDIIRQEIERRKKYESENYHDRKADGRPNEGWAESLAIMGELEELLSFIDSLPEEKPSEDFPTSDEEVAKFLATHPKVEVPEKYKTPNWLFDKQPSEDLEEAADNHIRKVVDAAGHPGWDWVTQDIADAFIAGAEWQKSHLTVEDIKTILDISFWNDDPEKILEEYNRLKK